MAQGYPIANVYSERHMETIERKIENCHSLTDESLNYMQNPKHLSSSLKHNKCPTYLNEAGDLFQEFSRQLSLLALNFYLHDIVTPGIPYFDNRVDRINFWSCVCTNKILVAKKYLNDKEHNTNPQLLDSLWHLLRKFNNAMKKLIGNALE